MPTVLVVGASRGLGAELVKKYAAKPDTTVIATSRSETREPSGSNIKRVSGIDVGNEEAGSKLAAALKDYGSLNVVIISAGYFATESFDKPNWQDEIKMYSISSIGPVFIVHHLVKAGLVAGGAKIILVSSESGSITLRHESEGGGNYAHHASKSALNMVGKLLSLDLKEKDIAVGMVHVSLKVRVLKNNSGILIGIQPGFMRTEMTKVYYILFLDSLLENLVHVFNEGCRLRQVLG